MATQKIGTTTYDGASGTSYEFSVYKKGFRFNDFIPGVFYLVRQDDDAETGVFIGESDNVDPAMVHNENAACFEENNYNTICFHRVANPSKRKAAFEDLSRALTTTCN
jgi:hypothetical protein